MQKRAADVENGPSGRRFRRSPRGNVPGSGQAEAGRAGAPGSPDRTRRARAEREIDTGAARRCRIGTHPERRLRVRRLRERRKPIDASDEPATEGGPVGDGPGQQPGPRGHPPATTGERTEGPSAVREARADRSEAAPPAGITGPRRPRAAADRPGPGQRGGPVRQRAARPALPLPAGSPGREPRDASSAPTTARAGSRGRAAPAGREAGAEEASTPRARPPAGGRGDHRGPPCRTRARPPRTPEPKGPTP